MPTQAWAWHPTTTVPVPLFSVFSVPSVVHAVVFRDAITMATQQDQKPLADYEVLLCVTGGIACYKAADLCSKLVQRGAGVTVAMTDSAQQFVGPVTFQSLSNRPVYSSMWQSIEYYSSQHISLTELADLMLIVPATANIIGKLANGIADDLVSTMALAATGSCPILLAPAMNSRMWANPAVEANMQRLVQWGTHIIGPCEGNLACRTVGMGRMAEPADILAKATELLLAKRAKKTVAGGQ